MQVLWIVPKFCEKFSCEEYKYEIIHTIISIPTDQATYWWRIWRAHFWPF